MLLGTVFPLLAEALQGSQLSVGEPYFDRMATPIGLALLFLMAVAPALPWRATSGEVLRNRLLVPAWIGGLTMLVAVILGARGWPRSSRSGSARSRPRASCASSCSAFAVAGARWVEARAVALGRHRTRSTRGSTAGSSCTSVSC